MSAKSIAVQIDDPEYGVVQSIGDVLDGDVVSADTPADAAHRALEKFLSTYPEHVGWFDHQATCKEISVEKLRALACVARSEEEIIRDVP